MAGHRTVHLAKRIGELLVSEGRISHEILSRALELQGFNEKGLRLGGILLKWGLLREEEILDTLSRLHRCPFVGWSVLSAADPAAFRLLSPALAERLGALPYAVDDRTLQVAFVNPSDLAAVDEVTAITKKRVRPAVALEVRLVQAQQIHYGLAISPGVWAVLHRLERSPRKRDSGARATGLDRLDGLSDTLPLRAAVPPPLPDFSMPETEEPVLSLARPPEPESIVAERPVPIHIHAERETPPEDPFADSFSLRRFISDAIEFFDGLPNLRFDIVDEPVEDLDPTTAEGSAPPPRRDMNATTPSRMRPRGNAAAALYDF
jgi:hypothetical protein